MKTLIKGDDIVYCIGSRTGDPGARRAAGEARRTRFDQDAVRAPSLLLPRAQPRGRRRDPSLPASTSSTRAIVHPPEDGSQFAPGYYSVLFEDPDGIRVEVNHVPGKGHLGPGGRLGPEGAGPATRYGADGLRARRKESSHGRHHAQLSRRHPNDRPFYFLYEPPPGTPWRNTQGRPPTDDDPRRASARARRPRSTARASRSRAFASAVESFEGAAIPAYYREVEELVKRAAGARRVVAFDHNLRSSARGVRRGDGPNEPVRFPHNDYTERFRSAARARSVARRGRRAAGAAIRGGQRVETDRLARSRSPRSPCATRARIAPGDLVPTDLRYRDRKGEVYSCASLRGTAGSTSRTCGPTRRCCSSATTPLTIARASRPTAPSTIRPRRANARSRESIEVRTLAFF